VFVVALVVQGTAQAQTGAGTVTQTLIDIQNQIDNLNDNNNSQEQSQDQNQTLLIPAFLDGRGGHGGHSGGGSGGSKLPKTGVDAAEVGGIGTASLLAGVSLMEFARRRRRGWFAPATASEAMATTPLAPMNVPVGGEGDLLLPYAGPATAIAPPPVPDDGITPSF
jgi:hypothetical protein